MDDRVYDVVIVGAGIAGCASARALRRADPKRQRKILLVDLHSHHNPRFSGEFLHPRGVTVLRELGLYRDLVAKGAVRMAGFLVFEQPDSEPVRLQYDKIPDQPPLGLSVDHVQLNRSLREQIAKDPGIDVLAGWRAVSLIFGNDGQTVQGIELEQTQSKDRIRVQAGTVIAADGKRSPVRKLANISDDARSLGFTAGLACRIEDLHEPAYAHVFLGAPGPMLLYAIEHQPPQSFRYRITIDLPHDLPAKGPALRAYLRQHYLPYLPPKIARACHETLAQNGKIDMAPAVDLPALAAKVPGLVLVGDAAGCSHPITASGMTMALLDAEQLGRVARARASMLDDDPWLSPGDLQAFHAQHNRYVPTRQAVASAIAESFRGESEGARCIRQALFAYWRASPKNARRSLALLSCVEARPQVFLSEYAKAARHALAASLFAQHATQLPLADRLYKLRGTLAAAQEKLNLVADVGWKQIRPAWWKLRQPQRALR